MRRVLFSVILLFITVGSLFAYRMYGASSPEVQELRRLYTLEGRAFPSSALPVSGERVAVLAQSLIPGAQSPGLEDAVENLIEGLKLPRGDEAVWGSELGARLEGTLGGETGTDPRRTFHDRFWQFPDLLSVALFAEREDYPGLHISFAVKREYSISEVPPSNLFFASANDPFKIELYFIRTGYLAWENDAFEVRFGRSPVHYGDSRFSTFLPSQRIPFLDALEYRYRIGPVQMVSYIATLDNRLTVEEQAFFGNGGNLEIYRDDTNRLYLGEDNWFYSSSDGPPDYTDEYKTGVGFARNTSLSTMHRFVFELDKAAVGITAQSMVSREGDNFQFGDVFPVFSWHNSEVGSHNMSLLFDVLWSVVPGIDIYGQAGWDDINASDLMGLPDQEIPTIGAYLFGAAYEGTVAGLPLGFTAEAGTTHYLWGNYYAYSTKEKEGTYFARSIYRYRTQRGIYAMPLTSPYGPGASWVDARMTLGPWKGLSGEMTFSYLSALEAASLISTDYGTDDTIKEGPRSDSWAASARLNYQLPPRKSWRASAYAGLDLYGVDTSFWPEFKLGAKISGISVKTF